MQLRIENEELKARDAEREQRLAQLEKLLKHLTRKRTHSYVGAVELSKVIVRLHAVSVPQA
jgi:hypothetical protein